MNYVLLLGRILYSVIFIISSFGHFSQSSISYAEGKGVPLAAILVPLMGIIEFLGGVSILIGFRARIGAWLLVIFLVPVTLMMHNFWAVSDPSAAQNEMAAFMKNIALLGTALMISYFGSGPLSVDRIEMQKETPRRKKH